jgi:hypothetical protein
LATNSQNSYIIICGPSAIRTLRCEQRRYGCVRWKPVDYRAACKALRYSTGNTSDFDYSQLEMLGAWQPGEELHVLVNDARKRGNVRGVHFHVSGKPLPSGALMELAPNVGILSPQMIAAVYARSHSFARTYAFFEELCGNITLSETGYTEWLADMRSTEEEGAATLTDESPYYVCEPALSPYGLRNWLGKVANVPGISGASKVARYVLGGARSPMEIMMFGQFCLPIKNGGFGCKNGKSNYRIDFNDEAITVSGMPYALGDLVFPASREILEYKGHPHDTKASRIRDEKREAGLAAMGYGVTSINSEQIMNITALEAIAKRLHRQAGSRFRYTVSGYRNRQFELMQELHDWAQNRQG